MTDFGSRRPSTLGGKFDSIGNVSDQTQNLALITRLLGEIGQDGYALPCVTPNDRIFICDCRIKLNQEGGRAVYGWRQVEKMVEIHRRVVDERKRLAENAKLSGAGAVGGHNEARKPEGGNGPLDTPS